MEPSEFNIDQRLDPDGRVRLTISGELDINTALQLRERLYRLRQGHAQVRLDIAPIEFIDSSGLRVILEALGHSRQDGWGFEVDPDISPAARRLFDLAGVSAYISR